MIRCATAMTVSKHNISDDPRKAPLPHRQKIAQGSNYILLASSKARIVLIAVNHGGLSTMIWRKLRAACRHTRRDIGQPLIGLRWH